MNINNHFCYGCGFGVGRARYTCADCGEQFCRGCFADHEILRGYDPASFHREVQILTPKEIRMFLPAADPGLYRTLFITAIRTGARERELFALRWGDIREGSGLLNSQVIVGRRRVNVDPVVILNLKKWKLTLSKSGAGDLVFPSPSSGEPLSGDTVYEHGFLPAIRRSGLARIRPNDLRHTFASLLIARGEHPKFIQMEMGHSSMKVTMDTYGHLMTKVNVELCTPGRRSRNVARRRTEKIAA